MIEIERDDTKIKVNISTDLPHDCEGESPTFIPFEWDEGSPYRAEMLKRYIEQHLEEWIRQEREALYNKGYQDGRGHYRKQVVFSKELY